MRSMSLNHHERSDRSDLCSNCAAPRYVFFYAVLAVLLLSRGVAVPAGLGKASHVVLENDA